MEDDEQMTGMWQPYPTDGSGRRRYVHERRWRLDVQPIVRRPARRSVPAGSLLDRIGRLVSRETRRVERTANIEAIVVESSSEQGGPTLVRLRIRAWEDL
jgi:hypothetical protein